MSELVLKTTQLSKSYNGRVVVDNIDMTIQRGEIYGFIGKNGAGKTTLLRMVTSLVRPSSGAIELFGSSDTKDLQNARTRIGAMIETPTFFPKLTAWDNLEYYRLQRGLPDAGEIDRVLHSVNLTDTGKKPYHQFSLGMKQRLGLALAIMGNPEFLLLDEPINGLDPTGMIEFRNIIHRLHRESNITLLISSHILSELEQVATRYGIIHNGRLLKEFTRAELDQQTRGYISVKVNNAPIAGDLIREELDTNQFEVCSQEEIRLFTFFDDPSVITSLLSANGLRVYSSNEVKINLEDYFISVIEAEKGCGENDKID
jgi:ABC-2 type transport system ATP-binding protein